MVMEIRSKTRGYPKITRRAIKKSKAEGPKRTQESQKRSARLVLRCSLLAEN